VSKVGFSQMCLNLSQMSGESSTFDTKPQIFRICGLKIKNNFALQELNRQFINQMPTLEKTYYNFFNYCLDVKNQQLLKNATIVLLTFKPFNEGSGTDKY
jgi:hypothetical protein